MLNAIYDHILFPSYPPFWRTQHFWKYLYTDFEFAHKLI